jgi:hypothetical protein
MLRRYAPRRPGRDFSAVIDPRRAAVVTIDLAVLRRATLQPLALLALIAGLAGCPASDCDRFAAWRNEPSTPCQTCLGSMCSAQRLAVTSAPTSCSGQFACVARCPDQSEATCGCVEGCFRDAMCRALFDAMVSCEVAHCDGPCR